MKKSTSMWGRKPAGPRATFTTMITGQRALPKRTPK